MSRYASILGSLSALFREELHIEVPSPDTDLVESGLLDSMQLVQLLLRIEDRLGAHLPLDEVDLEDLRSLSRLARLVAMRTEPERVA